MAVQNKIEALQTTKTAADLSDVRQIPLDISVVVPVYNTGSYLEQCLNSLVAQDACVREIICIDDGSTDNSPQILDGFASHENRVRVIHRTNNGYGSAVNEGFSLARSVYVGIVEPDDYTDTTLYGVLANAAGEHGRPDIVKTSYWRVCNADDSNEHLSPAFYQGRITHVNEPFTINQDAELLFHHPSIWSAIYRRQFLLDNDITFLEEPGAGWVDNPFFMETMLAAHSIVYLDKPLYYYREFSDALSGGLHAPSIIAKRWLEMDDIVHARSIESDAVLEAHLSRGCSYIEMLEHDFESDNKTAQQGIRAMIARMSPDTIMMSDKIRSSYKEAYLRALSPRERLVVRLRKCFHR